MPPEGPLVAITGAGGFLGGAIVRRLMAEGFRVRALSTGASAPPEGAERLALPAPDAADAAFARALEGATHLVHAGALNNADKRLGDAAYQGPNVELTAKVARSAARVLPGRMVFLSSIRAAAGPLFDGAITDDLEPRPADAYGRSKRAGEVAAIEAYGERGVDLAILRLAPVYGPRMKGMLGGLLRLADTPWPLPLAGLGGRRSVLGLDAAAEAVAHLIGVAALPASPMVAGDRDALTVGEMVAAMRDGLGRPRRLLRAPGVALSGAAGAVGRRASWQALAASQPCSPGRLVASGWKPVSDSRAGLAEAARGLRETAYTAALSN